jgi:Subtilase family/Peptidase inhibitor I9
MQRLITGLASASAALLLLSGSALPGTVPTQVQEALSGLQRDVIVILRDQLANVPPLRRAMTARESALAQSQNSVIASFPQLRARNLKSFRTINAFAVTVSATEQAQLSAHPMVQAVVPDAPIRTLPHGVRTHATSPSAVVASADISGSEGALCNTLEPQALQLTNAAFADPTIPQAQEVLDGNGRKVRGKGVKVAFIADALDPTLGGFVHQDGSPVFIDYQDFTGEPAGTPTQTAESFGDASSIAAQDMPNGKPLTFDISKYVNEAHPLPSPCNIRIRGMAPDASLVGLVTDFTASNVVQAIEYAVINDDVDVISESFGFNRYPDNANDPISLANDGAVQAGTTVVVATGDASADTFGSPATGSNVIAAGETTAWRVEAQVGYNDIPLAKGFLNNNIAGPSSSGFSQKSARMLDVVAPGDAGWSLCSTNQSIFQDCGDFTNEYGATPVQVFGGTSAAAPLIAGEAALIIQAYRSTHRGADPTPELIKGIIKSTATDLSAPAYEQGAGLINALAAVNAALSVDDAYGKPQRRGSSLLATPSSVEITDSTNEAEVRSFLITNSGATTQHLTPTLELLGAPFAGATLTVKIDAEKDPTFVDGFGQSDPYTSRTFNVPVGTEHLDVAIAVPAPLGTTTPPLVAFVLVDPSGRQAAFSDPMGIGQGYGHADVVNPAWGKWTAFLWTVPEPFLDAYSGPIQLSWSAERFITFGSVHPAQFDLPPGASTTVTAEFAMPSVPGDLSAAIRFDHSPNAAAANFPEIPVALRALIPIGATGGNFTGTLTGGNGRPAAGPYQTFEFDVPVGVKDMALNLNVADNGYLLEGLLVDPNGMQLSVQPNQDPLNGSAQHGLTVSHYDPQPGRWKFVLLQNFYSSGNQTSLPFTARIGFNTARITAPTLPNSARVTLSASAAPVTVPIQVTNTGALTRAFFADARLNTSVMLQLPPQVCGTVATLPGGCGIYYVPTQVSTAAFVAQASVPISMDAANYVGSVVGFTYSPDVLAKTIAPTTAMAVISEPEVPVGNWFVEPSQIGPFGPSGAPTVPFSTSAYVLMQAFDPAISADSGDAWIDLTLNTSTFNPLLLAAGATGAINVTITPDSSQVGRTVSGFIFVDTFDLNVYSGDEVVRIPYSYTVAP